MELTDKITLKSILRASNEAKLNIDSINYSSLNHDDQTRLAKSLGQIEFINEKLKELSAKYILN